MMADCSSISIPFHLEPTHLGDLRSPRDRCASQSRSHWMRSRSRDLRSLLRGDKVEVYSLGSSSSFYFFGLGRDPRTDEYKIFAFSGYRGDKVEVYSLGSSSSWRVLDMSYFFDGSRWIDVIANYSHMHALAITPP
ncbi:hypothetical protein Dimus_032561 [Dionaea muscipula]